MVMVRALDYVWDAQTAGVRASAVHFIYSPQKIAIVVIINAEIFFLLNFVICA